MKNEIVIIDYGMGNLHSVSKAVEAVGAVPIVTADKKIIAAAEKIILPGVGAFGDCMKNLQATGLVPELIKHIKSGKGFLGICLGMQLLFESSEESPGVAGLGIFKGAVKRLTTEYKVPHMGWNRLKLKAASTLTAAADGSYVYFVHSFHAVPEDSNIITAVCDYGTEITAAVGRDNIQALQFHPEKSGEVGLKMLQAFKEWKL
jgi:glutamine amidotransferase